MLFPSFEQSKLVFASSTRFHKSSALRLLFAILKHFLTGFIFATNVLFALVQVAFDRVFCLNEVLQEPIFGESDSIQLPVSGRH
jgi:hypothetical protein